MEIENTVNVLLEYYDGPKAVTCRSHIRRLLRNTGLRLPRHGSKDIVEVELTASKPKE